MANWIRYITIVTIVPVIYIGQVSSTEGGLCYSYAQKHCQDQLTQLVVAQREGRNNNICRYFGDVHSCTLKFMSQCKVEKEEQALYQRDIVQVYTNKPYSCALIGGNLQLREEHEASGGDTVIAPALFLLLLPFMTLM